MKEHNLKIQVFSEGTVNRGTHFFVDCPRWKPKDNIQSLKEFNDATEDIKYHHRLKKWMPFGHGKFPKVAATTRDSGKGEYSSDSDDENLQLGTVVDPFQRQQSSLISKVVAPQTQPSEQGGKADKSLDALSILVVDDSALNRKMLIRTLQQHRVGQTFEGLNDGLKLLNHFGVEIAAFRSDSYDVSSEHCVRSIEMKYDVILLDDHMTEMDGSVAIRNLRKAGYSGLVVGLTGSVSDEDLNVFCAAGADYALPKPFVMDDFVRILLKHFNA
jgi:CheY-like chemotaxis protein